MHRHTSVPSRTLGTVLWDSPWLRTPLLTGTVEQAPCNSLVQPSQLAAWETEPGRVVHLRSHNVSAFLEPLPPGVCTVLSLPSGGQKHWLPFLPAPRPPTVALGPGAHLVP